MRCPPREHNTNYFPWHNFCCTICWIAHEWLAHETSTMCLAENRIHSVLNHYKSAHSLCTEPAYNPALWLAEERQTAELAELGTSYICLTASGILSRPYMVAWTFLWLQMLVLARYTFCTMQCHCPVTETDSAAHTSTCRCYFLLNVVIGMPACGVSKMHAVEY